MSVGVKNVLWSKDDLTLLKLCLGGKFILYCHVLQHLRRNVGDNSGCVRILYLFRPTEGDSGKMPKTRTYLL